MSRPSEAFFNEVRLLYQSLVQVSAELHAGSNVSLGMRAVLEYLNRIRLWRYLLGDDSFDADYWLTRVENEFP